jgi:hypothetical protein
VPKYQVHAIRAWEVYGEVEAEDEQWAMGEAYAAIAEIPDDEWDELETEVEVVEVGI